MNISLVYRLRCPFCGGTFSLPTTERAGDELEYTVLACYCDHYPVVAGIPILKKGAIGTAGQTAGEVIALIEAGRDREALLAMIMPPPPASAELAPAWMQALPSVRGVGRLQGLAGRLALRKWREQAVALLTGLGDHVMACDLLDLYFRRSGMKNEYYTYFVFRGSQPRHLVALSFASLIRHPHKPILDLACGVGHITRYLLHRAQAQPVIGLDLNFIYLYVAKGWIAPQGEYVCCAADISLPFPDGTFSTAFCSDAFQIFDHKVTCMRELKRLTQDDGLIILVALLNVLVNKQLYNERWGLPPAGYEGLVADMPHRLIANRDVLAQYLQKQGPPLARSADIGRLTDEQWLSVVATHRKELLQDYGGFEEWPHAAGRLMLNPLYREEGRDKFGKVHLRLTMPSAWYAQENGACRQYEPETVSIDAKALIDLAHGRRTEELERLLEQCVVLGMPERYLSVCSGSRAPAIIRD
jgi:SAM-dependent methyltransferase